MSYCDTITHTAAILIIAVVVDAILYCCWSIKYNNKRSGIKTREIKNTDL